MSDKPRLAFVLQRALGWNTYRAQLEQVVAARTDIEALVIGFSHSGAAALRDKRHNMSRLDRLVRRRDPILSFQGAAGVPIRRQLDQFRPMAAHFAGHWPAAAIAYADRPVPFSVALDTTRQAMERSLPRGVWSAADFAREGELLRRAAVLAPMSRWTAASLVEDCGVDERRIMVMPPSLSLDRFAPARRFDQGPLRVIFIGNDVKRKGLGRLAAWVAGPLAGQVELHVVSTDPQAQTLASAGGGGVVFHGRVANDELVRSLLPEMEVLCLPTLSDMSPQVLAEAAAAGLATVASALGGIPDLVRAGQTGLLVDPHDDQGFVAALARLAAERRLAWDMGEAGAALARSTFDAYANFNRLIDRLVVSATSSGGDA